MLKWEVPHREWRLLASGRFRIFGLLRWLWLCLRNFSLCLVMRLFSFAVVRRLRVVWNFYWVSFFSFAPLERVVDFSAWWAKPCSKPSCFLFCLEFTERTVKQQADVIAKAAELLVQTVAVSVNMPVIKRYPRHHLGWNSISDGLLKARIFKFCGPFWHHITYRSHGVYFTVLPCEHAIQVHTAGRYRPHTLQQPPSSNKSEIKLKNICICDFYLPSTVFIDKG